MKYGSVKVNVPPDDLMRKKRRSNLSLMFRLKGTVVLKIWWQGLLIVLYTAGVVCVHNYVPGMHMDFPLTLVPVLGVATSLVLAFRTNTAYGRYWEGRGIWSKMTTTLRTLTLCIWVGVGDEDHHRPAPGHSQGGHGDPPGASAASTVMIEKMTAVNLLIAFAYATKNYLRGEYSYDEEDMKHLISHVPKFQTPSSNQPFHAQNPYYKSMCRERKEQASQLESRNLSNGWWEKVEREEQQGHHFHDLDEDNNDYERENLISNLSSTINSGEVSGGGVSVSHDHGRRSQSMSPDSLVKNLKMPDSSEKEDEERRRLNTKTRNKNNNNNGPTKQRHTLKAHDVIVPSNIPIEIIHYLFSYMRHVGLERKDSCDKVVLKHMFSSLLSLIDCLTGFEQILRTPIPLAYSVHLHYCVWLYLLSLPYQLVGSLNWLTIPAVALASFALLGILRIGWEIENPFGYEDNDLPLDDFCKVIRREVKVIVGHRLPKLSTWVMSADNHPLAPSSWLNAEELSMKSVDELRDILAAAKGTEMRGNNSYP